MRRRAAQRLLVAAPIAVSACIALGALSSCGSRTGLLELVGQDDGGLEAGVDGQPFFDGPSDAASDVPFIDVSMPDVPVINPCPDAAATLIYVIGLSGVLYSFDPNFTSFTTIGKIRCPDSVGTPFSMAVDRQGIAYVIFAQGITHPDGTGEELGTGLYRVNTGTAECAPTAYDAKAHGNITFGMGFVADPSDGGDGGETLFVSQDSASDGVLGTIDTTTFELRTIGSYEPSVQQAELTGTGRGQLFAFQPYLPSVTTESIIYELDPRTARVTAGDPLPGIVGGRGWAFGFWGGSFYTFTTPSTNDNMTVVHSFDPATKVLSGTLVTISDTITGAGVSTCAPSR